MNARAVTVSEEYLARLEHGADWREEIEEFCARKSTARGVRRGVTQPAADDVPYNDPISRSLDPGSQLTVTFEPPSR